MNGGDVVYTAAGATRPTRIAIGPDGTSILVKSEQIGFQVGAGGLLFAVWQFPMLADGWDWQNPGERIDEPWWARWARWFIT